MNTTKATYWIALATFALALNSEYRHGKFPGLHRVAGRAGTTLCRITTRAEQTLAMARLLTVRPGLPAQELLASNAAEIAENQAEMLREQARDEAEVLREQGRDQAETLRDQVRAQADILRAEAQLQRAHRFTSAPRTTAAWWRSIPVRAPKVCVSQSNPGRDGRPIRLTMKISFRRLPKESSAVSGVPIRERPLPWRITFANNLRTQLCTVSFCENQL
jgi:hypothetical protein